MAGASAGPGRRLTPVPASAPGAWGRLAARRAGPGTAIPARRPGGAPVPTPIRLAAATWAAFAALALALAWPALHAPFFSDDFQYVVNDPYIQRLDGQALAALLDPRGEPAVYTWNYAPVHLLVHALQWRAFGADPLGYHVTSVLLHAATATLFVLLLVRWGLPRRPALLAGLVFLVHPANVETVIWVFQVKTILALAFSLAACLCFPRRPLVGLALFALGMLAKVTAVAALPALGLWLWLHPHAPRAGRREWAWLAGFAAVALVCLALEFPQFHSAQAAEARYPDLATHARSVVAIAGRYLAMATTTAGLSALQEPPPSPSWSDPWWWLGAAGLVALGWRGLAALRRRSLEAVFLGWAAASWALVSQVFPFLYPMGDHYLYPILPGLLGAAAVGLVEAAARPGLVQRLARREALAAAALALVVVAFGARSVERARVWRSDLSLARDSAEHFPDGKAALYLRARRAVGYGDLALATAELERLAATGFDGFFTVAQDPTWAPLRGDPRFQAALARMAGNWLATSDRRPILLQGELRVRALAEAARGDRAAAIREYERALARGGPLDDVVRAELDAMRAPAAGGG